MIIKTKRGFTIIELIASIAIIAVLFTIIFAVVKTTKERSRDSRRMVDLHEIENALALYVVKTKKFPISEVEISITGNDLMSLALEEAKTISEVPVDPLSIGQYVYKYKTDAQGSAYTIFFCLETNTISNYLQGCGNMVQP
jgi:prepilin-type N-terminal cleavage/methylation domain-containing protein